MPLDNQNADIEKPDESVRANLERAFAEKGSTEPLDSDKPNDAPAPVVTDKVTESKDAPAGGDKPVAKTAAGGGDKSAPKDTPALSAPVKWTKEEKEAWEKMTDGLPPEAAAAVQKIQGILVSRNKNMEGEFTKQMQAIATDRAWKGEIDKLLEPRRQAWKAAGLSDAAAMDQLLAGFDYSVRDLPGFVNWICAQRGTTLDALFPQRAAANAGRQQQQQHMQDDDGDEVQLHPKVQRMLEAANQQVTALRGQITQMQQGYGQTQQAVQSWQQQQEQQLHQEIEREISTFSTATDETGQPKYPFYSQVSNDMGRLIDAGMANGMEDAYDKAIYARPELRTKLLESHEVKVKRSFEQKLQDDAKRARAASGSLAPGGSHVTSAADAPEAVSGSVRAALEAARNAYTQGNRRI